MSATGKRVDTLSTFTETAAARVRLPLRAASRRAQALRVPELSALRLVLPEIYHWILERGGEHSLTLTTPHPPSAQGWSELVLEAQVDPCTFPS